MQKKVEIACKTDVGMVRTENQDHFGILEPENDEVQRSRGALVLVADGMGGHTGGTVASHTAVDNFLQTFEAGSSRGMRVMLDESIRAANDAVRAKAEKDPNLREMGTTCVAAVIRGNAIVIGHLGDSRCYLIRDGKIRQVTRDHTYLNELIDMGLLTPEQAEGHPDKNIITRCVGMAQKLEIEFNHLDALPGDRLVLCSDGLTNMVRDDEICEISLMNDPEEACEKLIARANEQGGDDNITVAILVVHELPEADPALLAIDVEDAKNTVSRDTELTSTETVASQKVVETVSPDAKTPTAEMKKAEVEDLEDTKKDLKPVRDEDLDETVRVDDALAEEKEQSTKKDDADQDEDPPTHPAWFWLIGAEIVVLILLQMWISRL